MSRSQDAGSRKDRFKEVFAEFGLVEAYARRRGSRDPDGIAAETMTIAWRRLDSIDPAHHRPWLLSTARNLLFAEYRGRRVEPVDPHSIEPAATGSDPGVGLEVESLDPEIDRALRALAPADREALLLVAWEELSPAEAAS